MGTKFQGSVEEKIVLDCFIKLFRASELIRNKSRRVINDTGFSNGQFFVLDALYHLGSMPQKILSEKIMRTEGNLTMIISNLLKRKLIRRVRSKQDGRVYIISLTEKGKTEYEKLFPYFLHAVKSDFDVLSKEEKILLQNICRKLGEVKAE
ncbi:MarR family winged helix-turn-helix transcriptional regulator [Ignavibacterium sp.]|uniref:MarR family winged helix-turn-helix transcriptional regulator n=1 Tax=Ignavibacterium sp. TaxID=2651167 RepID=UPI00307EC7EB